MKKKRKEKIEMWKARQKTVEFAADGSQRWFSYDKLPYYKFPFF